MAAQVAGPEEARTVGTREVMPLLRLIRDRPVLSPGQDEEGREETPVIGDASAAFAKRDGPGRAGVPEREGGIEGGIAALGDRPSTIDLRSGSCCVDRVAGLAGRGSLARASRSRNRSEREGSVRGRRARVALAFVPCEGV